MELFLVKKTLIHLLPSRIMTISFSTSGAGAALFAKNKLHYHIKHRLLHVSNMLVMDQQEIERKYFATGLIMNIDAEKLIIGALEEAFVSLDEEIKQERYDFHIQGGCTALVAIIIKGIVNQRNYRNKKNL